MLELAGIIIFGVFAYWLAWKTKLPAILPLILIGLMVGPLSTLYTADGTKWIEPVWNGEEGLFPGERLFNFVSLAIAIILFEGGLTLKKDEIASIGYGLTALKGEDNRTLEFRWTSVIADRVTVLLNHKGHPHQYVLR